MSGNSSLGVRRLLDAAGGGPRFSLASLSLCAFVTFLTGVIGVGDCSLWICLRRLTDLLVSGGEFVPCRRKLSCSACSLLELFVQDYIKWAWQPILSENLGKMLHLHVSLTWAHSLRTSLQISCCTVKSGEQDWLLEKNGVVVIACAKLVLWNPALLRFLSTPQSALEMIVAVTYWHSPTLNVIWSLNINRSARKIKFY